MTMPYYVSPEQLIKDKADYARKGISRGRSVIVLQYADGIAFVAENPSRALHKISEIYDRIAFAAVGKYNEFENLRQAGVRFADMRGFSYDRADVTARSLANAYAQTLGNVFTEAPKPYEVEIVVAEVGVEAADDQLYRLTFDGSVADEHGFVAMGGSAEAISSALAAEWNDGLDLESAVRLAVGELTKNSTSLNGVNGSDGERGSLSVSELEVAILDRNRPRRRFKRIIGDQLTALLSP
jgi:proteasome alpha subunit